MIKLKGLFDISLGGFLCIRGYAKLGDLTNVSKADAGYQRDLIRSHSKEIEQFLLDKTNLFFPEVVLSCKLRYDFQKKDAISGLNPIANVQNKIDFKSNVNKIAIRFQKNNALATITIDETDNNALLNRVDGNHRLEAARLRDEFKDYIAPFCIILLADDAHDDKRDKIIFHNINFKAIPLEEEHSLKILLEDEGLFSDESLKTHSFGWEYLLARKILSHIHSVKYITVLQDDKPYRTLIKASIKLLLENKIITGEEKSVEKILNALEDINSRCKLTPVIGKNVGVFSALLAMQIKNPKLVPSFINWIGDSQISNIKEISAKSLLDIFEKRVTGKCRDVFISLKIEHKECEKNYSVIKSVIDEINNEYFSTDKELNLIPIRIDKSDDPYTFQITDKIIQKIEDCGLFIADLTGMNPNVYHESGYAMGYITGKELDNKIIFILYHRDASKDVEKKVAFNLRNYSQIRFSDRSKFREQIKQKIKAAYGLGDAKAIKEVHKISKKTGG